MRERLDTIMVNRGCAVSRTRAKEMIRSGCVFVDGRKAEKAGAFYDSEGKITIEVREDSFRYVSRGGLKLEKAVKEWDIALEGMVCVDIGASTGGFTDCMLRNGAARVYSVDVGHVQLAEKLRQDPRVVCMEGRNFRYMTKEDIPEELDFASADVSFISLTKILPPAFGLLKRGGRMVCLVKPQFEAGRGRVGKNGVVREPGIHREVICGVAEHAEAVGFRVLGLGHSPVRGPEGNIEYLLYLEKGTEEDRGLHQGNNGGGEASGILESRTWKQLAEETVAAAWKCL